MKYIEKLIKVDYADEMKKSFIDYAMSVIVERALPDVRDGLKPVHRRILRSMEELRLYPESKYRKSARIVGDTLGKYHPHGDTSVYGAMVRMAQPFSLNLTLVDGHGNFGSIDGDSAAAMRYTEAKLSKIAMEMLTDMEKGVVDFVDNFDGTEREPTVLPSRFPNLLVNGTQGIAVGMATYIPPHNLNEVIKAIMDYLDNPDISISKIMKSIKGPDFPTGGIIVNKDSLESIYENGNGKIKVRAKIDIENTSNGKTNLIITEIPYNLSGCKTKLIEDIIDLVKEKKLDELSDVIDESSREGLRIILEVKKGINIENLLNKIYKKTQLQSTIGVNFLVIVDKKPEVLNIKQLIKHFVDFQKEITIKKYNYLLGKANERQEILSGLIKAHDVIDLIIEILRGSKDLKVAKDCLINGVTEGIKFKTKKSEKDASNLKFTEKQSQAILDMRLMKLIGLELEKLNEEYEELLKNIKIYKSILNNDKLLIENIKDYLNEIKKAYAQKRKTFIDEVQSVAYVEEFREEELYVLIDRFGYVKTIDVPGYTRSTEDAKKEFNHAFDTKNTDKLCIFTKEGNLYQIKLLDVPKCKIKDKGIPFDNLCKIGKEESIVIDMFSNIKDSNLIFTTKQGLIKLVVGAEFESIRSAINATKINEDDELLSILVLKKSHSHCVVISEKGYALKFDVKDIPELKKNTKGVKTIGLANNDFVTQVHLLDKNEEPLIINYGNKEVNLKSMKTKKRNQIGIKL